MSLHARKYIRHPSDIPIEVEVDEAHEERDALNNISNGGLSFHSQTELVVGKIIALRIPAVQPPFETKARVTWCRANGNAFDVGVELLDKEQAYRVRMVEQVCHIEHYKRKILLHEGRALTGEEAAREWIALYAERFPGSDQEFNSGT